MCFRWRLPISVFALLATVGWTDDPPQRFSSTRSAAPLVGDDVDGVTHRFGQSPGCKAVAVVFVKTDCPISNGAMPQLARLARTVKGGGVEFYAVVSESTLTRQEAIRYRDEFKPPFPVLFDASGDLRRRFKPTHAPQAFVLSHAGEVFYSGAIDDTWVAVGKKRLTKNRYLGDAIKAVRLGRRPGVRETAAIGCPYEELPATVTNSSVTFNRDIAPLVHRHCAVCHREGAVGPFPLETYANVRQRATLIRQVVTERQMPPWLPVPQHARFADDRSLSDREMALIERWVEAGVPEGDPDDLPPLPKRREGWALGPPDLVLTMPDVYELHADGQDMYMHFLLPSPLSADVMISAIDFRPGNARIVHHVNFCLDASGAARLLDKAWPGPGYHRPGGPGFIPSGYGGFWTPGVTPRHLPEGLGRRFPGGSDFVLQIHYHPTGKVERDQSQVALYFAPRGVRPVCEMFVGRADLTIPAEEDRSEHFATYTLPVDLTLLEITPHMHFLGREVEVHAEPPDGSRIPLILIRDWEFQWQNHYAYDTPLRLPGGTKVVARFVYDNSVKNSANPNSPPKTVLFGEQSTDEMASIFFRVTADTAGQLGIFVRHNQEYYDARMNEHFQRNLRTLDPKWTPSGR